MPFKHDHLWAVLLKRLFFRVVKEPLGTLNSLTPISAWYADGPKLT